MNARVFFLCVAAHLCAAAASCLAAAVDYVLVGTQLSQPHGAAGVQLLGADAHFAAQTKLAAVGKAGAGVHVDRCAVHTGREPRRCLGVRRDDSLAVVGGMLGNVQNRCVHVIHHGYAQLVVQIFRVKILRRGRHTVDDGGGLGVQVQLHRR